MISAFFKSLPLLINAGGPWCIVAILIAAGIGYYLHINIVNKLSKQVCKNRSNCLLNSFKTNRTTMLANINTIKNDAKDKYASDLVDYINSGNNISESVKDRMILVHGNLMDSVFSDFTLSMERMLLYNNIPKPHTDEFDLVMEERFNSFWSSLWSKYKLGYNQQFYRLDLTDRIHINEFKKSEYLKIFNKLFTISYNNTHKHENE